ncbi:hypothetical protein [Psychrobacter sp. NG27]|uniref:hypothetical protein n=1 Tax=Psychrobacter sp. NG27 TaxID=2781966 RepID=UPI0018E0271B|nr:hypothetical protein [Psychrobacter sp. NG27]MBI0426655.1 hypothetical protein [Psychrobacter sp. NG27]
MTNQMRTRKYSRKWLVLSVVATALLIIPRRSSRKSDTPMPNNHIPDKQGIKIDDADTDDSVESSDMSDHSKPSENRAIID